ncbi:transcription termination factor Rho [Candidatus Nardonella dryophthoridicola]|uniref:Transcription termination factor Rho n=1 Tax=endosymbiont of Rhynchophorus ferrugineus TaxID=1972133 RepID=A0A2Z5T9E5_9GAMM|nr:transcription termination factor Rho [Candidatus Nardonella dryophthoridicola]QTJ62908.1 transcription termination factor Rho [Candidatus Nardonella dryophthoridicola]BBA85156.1 transcription termination factor Rho [endosymbiont of Rhynchophorus ferrugineus]
MNLTELKNIDFSELISIGKNICLNNINKMKKNDIIFNILKYHFNLGNDISGDGVLEVLQDGFGFLRSANNSYLASPDDIYVSPNQIRKFNLKTGDTIFGKIRPPKDNEKYFALLKIDNINFENIDLYNNKILFENLVPLHTNIRLKMEIENNNDITQRMLDLVSPIGKGQRGLIVSPPKAGKTTLLQKIAKSITYNHPECYLIILLIDERPEEVTEMKKLIPESDVIYSTFDESPNRHIQISEIVIEKAKRLVENKKDVVILLDSITRLARAYNVLVPSSGKILTGGIDSNALNKPKKFFGAARNIQNGGSLTIIATALIETGSKMDDIIYEEFKGTGNMELHLSRKISEKRIFPSIDYNKSGTRKEELLFNESELNKICILRKILNNMNDVEAIEFLINKISNTKNNKDFFNLMKIK